MKSKFNRKWVDDCYIISEYKFADVCQFPFSDTDWIITVGPFGFSFVRKPYKSKRAAMKAVEEMLTDDIVAPFLSCFALLDNFRKAISTEPKKETV